MYATKSQVGEAKWNTSYNGSIYTYIYLENISRCNNIKNGNVAKQSCIC